MFHVPVVKHGDFNPRARVGRDVHTAGSSAQQRHFNPRARVGRDPARAAMGVWYRDFNPRARVGRDQAHIGEAHIFQKFQSTRPRGARRRDLHV